MTRKNTPKDLMTGTRHFTSLCGEVEVIEYYNCNAIRVKFDDGYETTVRGQALRKGFVRNPNAKTSYGVACEGVGSFSPKKDNKLYVLWCNMLKRVYSDSFKESNPSYKGCTVCERWLNFQNFCNDICMMDNFPEWYVFTGEFQLDKDSIIPNNKEYSPEACSLISRDENLYEMFKRKRDRVSALS